MDLLRNMPNASKRIKRSHDQLYLTVLSDVFPGWCVHVYAVLGFLGPDRVRLQWNHKIYEYCISDDDLQPQSSLRLDIEGERLTLIQGLGSWNWPCIRSEREYILAALVALAA